LIIEDVNVNQSTPISLVVFARSIVVNARCIVVYARCILYVI